MTTAMQEVPWEPCFVEPRRDPELDSYLKRLKSGEIKKFNH